MSISLTTFDKHAVQNRMAEWQGRDRYMLHQIRQFRAQAMRLASFDRMVPDNIKPKFSFLWYFDNSVDEEIRVMIYLDDIAAEGGALRVKNVAVSNQTRKLSFWHRNSHDRARSVLDDDGTTDVLEGETATAILFRPGRVIHKATAPRHDRRDVVALVLIPSLIPWRGHYARSRHLLSINAGICLDPHTDRPQNIGYHF